MAHFIHVSESLAIRVPAFIARVHSRWRVTAAQRRAALAGITVSAEDVDGLLRIQFTVSADCSDATATGIISDVTAACSALHRAVGGSGLTIEERKES